MVEYYLDDEGTLHVLYNGEECLVHALRQIFFHASFGNVRKHQVNARYGQSARHVQQKEPHVVLVVDEKCFQVGYFSVVDFICRHVIQSFTINCMI